MALRDLLEKRERETLSPYATLACESRGRQRPEAEHDYRTAFQRDRDRILHCKAFRRLKHKTQVFLVAEGDHYRTRLTHTLETAQIARTAARALFLNEDLTEAIALGHDLGHTPLGHAGEAVLDECYEPGFRHDAQSLRVVDKLESTRKGPGLNLTWEVRDGILYHSKGKSILEGRGDRRPSTLEGRLVSVCDAIAYINHDIDDAIRGGVITREDLPRAALRALGETTSERINTMVVGLIEGSREGAIGILPDVLAAADDLRAHMYEKVYPCEAINTEIEKAKRFLRDLYCHFVEHPTPEMLAGDPNEPIERHIVDFVAGMTDSYAFHLYAKLFFPSSWR